MGGQNIKHIYVNFNKIQIKAMLMIKIKGENKKMQSHKELN